MSEMNDKRWKLHAEFLGELADRVAWMIIAQGADRTEAVNEYTRWLAEKCFSHAEGHCREDFESGVFKRVLKPGESDKSPVDYISVSGDLVNRESLKLYPNVKLDGTSWDKTKREPHVYENADSVEDDDSVITSQAECVKRFAEGEAVRRNYAGIND